MLYDKVLGCVTEVLQSAITKIHFSFDLWTSKNQLALLGLVAHFINKKGVPTTTLLALPRQRGKHTGERLAETISEIIHAFSLQDKVGSFITDNASSNDTCLEHLAEELGFVAKECWIRCSGHTFNLVAQAVLFGSNWQAFELEIENATLEEQLLLHWRKKGPID